MLADESELIARTLSGDQAAYGDIIDRYKHAMYRGAYRIVRDEDIAEDIAQESFIKAYAKLASYDTSKKFSTWLFKIVTNTALDYLRRSKSTAPLSEDLTARIVSVEPSPQTRAEYAELHEAVARLRPRYRAVISLHYWQGLKIDEVAYIMNKPQGTVKGWLHRAKRELEKELNYE